MFNIFLAVFFATLAFAFSEPFLFIGYLISIALFGLYQAIFMANAGGAWDNAKKIVETELKKKGTALHAATVVGDTVGDPFKDTSSVALNPIIKFTTLFRPAGGGTRGVARRAAGREPDQMAGCAVPPGGVVLHPPLVLQHADSLRRQEGLRTELRQEKGPAQCRAFFVISVKTFANRATDQNVFLGPAPFGRTLRDGRSGHASTQT